MRGYDTAMKVQVLDDRGSPVAEWSDLTAAREAILHVLGNELEAVVAEMFQPMPKRKGLLRRRQVVEQTLTREQISMVLTAFRGAWNNALDELAAGAARR